MQHDEVLALHREAGLAGQQALHPGRAGAVLGGRHEDHLIGLAHRDAGPGGHRRLGLVHEIVEAALEFIELTDAVLEAPRAGVLPGRAGVAKMVRPAAGREGLRQLGCDDVRAGRRMQRDHDEGSRRTLLRRLSRVAEVVEDRLREHAVQGDRAPDQQCLERVAGQHGQDAVAQRRHVRGPGLVQDRGRLADALAGADLVVQQQAAGRVGAPDAQPAAHDDDHAVGDLALAQDQRAAGHGSTFEAVRQFDEHVVVEQPEHRTRPQHAHELCLPFPPACHRWSRFLKLWHAIYTGVARLAAPRTRVVVDRWCGRRADRCGRATRQTALRSAGAARCFPSIARRSCTVKGLAR